MSTRSGTTQRVGEIIQWGAEIDDEDLARALEAARVEAARVEAKTSDPEAPLPGSLATDWSVSFVTPLASFGTPWAALHLTSV